MTTTRLGAAVNMFSMSSADKCGDPETPVTPTPVTPEAPVADIEDLEAEISALIGEEYDSDSSDGDTDSSVSTAGDEEVQQEVEEGDGIPVKVLEFFKNLKLSREVQ